MIILDNFDRGIEPPKDATVPRSIYSPLQDSRISVGSLSPVYVAFFR